MRTPSNPSDTPDMDEFDRDFPYDVSSTSPSPSPAPEKVSVLGPTLVFKGELSAGEDLLVQGRIEGSVKHKKNLTIGEQGTVKANIRARNITVEGTVEGDLYGRESVVVKKTARIRGNIFAPRVGLVEGAKFKGRIDMDVGVDQAASKKSKSPGRESKPASDEISAKALDKLLKK